MVLLLERSGCGCTLKTGTIVIGALQALAGFSMMVSEALAAYRGAPAHLPRGPSPSLAAGGGGGAAAPEADDGGARQLVQGQRGLCAALSVAGALQLVLSVLLLYGADYENPRLVKPWVLFSMVLTSAIVAVYFGLAVLTFALGGHPKVGYAILVGILGTTALSTYFILVVYSFSRELVERSVVPCII
ncbi:hypothetical protein R5R35_009693 [Gryllus longicercus]|uniref:Uncharacterized protein n=1 Tax=Gryllus longicercus TaxID=2509291 RepID=A0AAN9Z0G6_9ORTH